LRIRMIWTVVVVAAVIAAACGDSKSSLMPTAPSSLSAEAASVVAGADDVESGPTGQGPKPGNGNGNGNGNNGGGNGNGNGNGNQPRTPTNTSPNPTAPMPPGKSKVEFEGLIQAVSSGSILVNGQAIMVTGETVIRHGNRTFELSSLSPGDRVHVRANRVTAAPAIGVLAEMTLVAAEIKLQNPGDGDDGEGEDDGLVSVMAFDASAVESGSNTGTFRLTRSGTPTQLALPLTVTLMLTGTATNGTDYAPVPTTATFAANQPTVDVVVTPLVDAAAEGPETVILTLTSVAPYEFGSPIAATVTITDAATALVSVTAPDNTASESGDTGRFVLTRTGDLSAPLAVTVTFNGLAVNGTDYETLSTTVNFAAGQAAASVFVIPMADAVVEPAETVILTVVDGAAYDLGAVQTATVTISAS
jgi:hypothetical protein